MKFQQDTGPIAAKGVEDTALYRCHRLVSLNEVGADPGRFGLSIPAFHRANGRRGRSWPHAVLAGSSHDSKRSEDVRARLHALSELPGEWRRHVARWARLNRRFRSDTDGLTVPDANAEYLLYQTLGDGSRGDLAESLTRDLADGRAKLYLIRQALQLRGAEPELFARGDYRPLRVEGPHADRLCAYARSRHGRSVVVLAPRVLAGLMAPDAAAADPFADPGWAATKVEVPAGELTDVLAGTALRGAADRGRHLLAAAEVLRRFPAGLLITGGEPDV
jgi:maltooligosyltrehalose synthase